MTLKQLGEISKRPVDRKTLMPVVDSLLAEFENVNHSQNGYVREKIGSVRTWFDELGKLGRGHFSIEEARSAAQEFIGKLERLIDSDGQGLRIQGERL